MNAQSVDSENTPRKSRPWYDRIPAQLDELLERYEKEEENNLYFVELRNGIVYVNDERLVALLRSPECYGQFEIANKMKTDFTSNDNSDSYPILRNQCYQQHDSWKSALQSSRDETFHLKFLREMCADASDNVSAYALDCGGLTVDINIPQRKEKLLCGTAAVCYDSDDSDSAREPVKVFDTYGLKDSVPFLKRKYVLSREEAFYLFYTKQLLFLYENNKVLSIDETWKRFCKMDNLFVHRVSVYRHLKNARWIVKCGLKFGCDFLLYAGHPDSFHANYGVLVVPNYGSVHTSFTQSWKFMSCLNRVLVNTKKMLCICYTFLPPDVSLDNYEILDKVVVKTVIFSRFLPEANRENLINTIPNELEEIP